MSQYLSNLVKFFSQSEWNIFRNEGKSISCYIIREYREQISNIDFCIGAYQNHLWFQIEQKMK